MYNYIDRNEHFTSGGSPTGVLISDFLDFVCNNLDSRDAKSLLSSFLISQMSDVNNVNIINTASDIDRSKNVSVVCSVPENVLDLDSWTFFVFDTDSIVDVRENNEELCVITEENVLPLECTFTELQSIKKKRVG